MFTLLFATLSFAAPSSPPPGPPPLDDALDTLTLDATTRAAIDKTIAAAEPELHELHDALRDREEQLLDDIRAQLPASQRAAFDAALPKHDGPPPAR